MHIVITRPKEDSLYLIQNLIKAKELGYKVGKELLRKAGSNFTIKGN